MTWMKIIAAVGSCAVAAGCPVKLGTGTSSASSGPTSSPSSGAPASAATAAPRGELWPGGTGECNEGAPPPLTADDEVFRGGWAHEHIHHVVDLDRDGDADALTIGFGGDTKNRVGFYKNQGATLVYQSPADELVTAQDVDPADIDGDGDLDLVVGTIHNHSGWTRGLAAVENLGGARAWKIHWVYEGHSSGAVAAGDLDGDGKIDVATMGPVEGGSSGKARTGVHWHRNQGGKLASAATAISTDFKHVKYWGSLDAADVDRDGDLDLIAFNGATLAWFENAGKGASWQLHYVTKSELRGIRVIDFDGDGDVDVLAAVGVRIVVFENVDGKGGFGETVLVRDYQARGIDAADLDGDGRLEIVADGDIMGALTVFRYDAGASACVRATARKRNARGWGYNESLRVGDLDGDGDIDVLATGRNTAARLVRNTTK